MIQLHPNRAYIFDVDGVLTNPQVKRIEQELIFSELINRLKRGDIVGFNTGRSFEFITQQVLEPLESRVDDKHLMQSVVAVCEKGAAWVIYDKDGFKINHVDKSISIPQKLQNEIKEVVESIPFKDIVFFDETKQTMITVELQPGKTEVDFFLAQKQLVVALKKLLINYDPNNQLRIDPTRIAIDIENLHAGKALGARCIVELLNRNNIEPKEYLCFGDSPSDLAMYEELQRLGKKVRFVFVGGKENLIGKSDKGVIFTKNNVDRGTLEFLQNET